ncbi:MAG: Cna B-type domain-containing protein [Eubacteriales bacterium]|nr:Cna B-type domain-containing protein [Eubacteriales bacterium]
MKKSKQIMSWILVLMMVLNLNFPGAAVFAEDGTATVENRETVVSTELKEQQNEPDKDVAGESGTESEKSDSTEEKTEETTETKPADNAAEKEVDKQVGETTEENVENAENGENKELKEEVLEENALPLGGPAFRRSGGPAKDITANVNKSRPDVYRVTEANDKYYIIKDGVVVDKPYELSSGHKVEFYYKWNIPHAGMKDLQAGDYFYIDLPEFQFLKLFGIKPDDEHPIASLDNPNEELGVFKVETGTKNRAKLILNEIAVKKHEIRDGYLMLRFRVYVKETLKFVPSSETVEGVVITEVPKSNQNKLIGNQAYRPDTKIYKGGASYDDASDNNKTKIEWNMYVNYKNLPLSLAGRLVDEKKEVWVEDDLNGTGMKIDPTTIRIYTAIYVPVNENADPKHQDAVISSDAVFWPSRQAQDFGNPKQNETYEEFKARFKQAFTHLKPFTVAIYPRDTGDAILYYLGDLSGDKTISYSDFRPGDTIDPKDPTKSKTLEREALNRLEKALKDGRITQKQFEGAKKLYGIDGNDQTKMKKMVAFHLRFASVRDKSGLVKNTATVHWHRGQTSANTSLYYSVGAAGAGYNEVTAIGVTKNWERKVGGPVTMQLWDETEDGKHKLIDFVRLGVKGPNPANHETDKWTYDFNDLPKFKRVLEGTSSVMKPIKYVVREKMSPEDVANFESALVDDNDDTQFTFNNKNTETVKVRVNKTWIPAGQVPQGVDSVKVNVVENKTNEIVLRDQLIFAADGWTKEFTVPKYNTNMEEASYTVVEVSDIPGYESQILADSANKSVTIYNIPTITFDVTKTWVGKPAAKATFHLIKANLGPVDTLHLTSANGWKGRFKPQPKYELNDTPIAYVVEEEPIAGYHSELEPLDEDSYKAVNTEFINVEVIKKWHTNSPTEITPVQVELYFKGENGKEDTKVPNIAPKTLEAKDGAKVVFENVPVKDDNGKDYEFTVKELNAPAGYEVQVEKTPNYAVAGSKSFTVHNIKKTDIKVTKIWKGPRTSITLVLKKDNAIERTEVVNLDANATEWSYSFTDLLMYDKTGHKFTYTVEEVDIANYDKDVKGDQENGFTVTNINNEKVAAIVAKKVWVDDSNALNKRPANITFVLKGVAGSDVVTYEKTLDANNAVAGNANEWQVSFDNLRKYSAKTGEAFTYTLEEVKVNGYNSSVAGDDQNGFTVTNTLAGKVSVSVTKEWIGTPTASVTVRLHRKIGANGAPELVEPKELKASNLWQHTFKNLPEYNAQGQKYTYFVTEDTVSGYTTEIRPMYPGAVNSFLVLNISKETVRVPFEKKWHGPKKSVTIRLFAGNTEVASKVLDETTGWTGSFDNLRKHYRLTGEEIIYTIKEDTLANYKTEITGNAKDGFIITNTNTETINIPVSKKWIGNIGNKIESIGVSVKANGSVVQRKALTKDNGWKETFTDLPKYDAAGMEIAYYLDEDKIDGYHRDFKWNDTASEPNITLGGTFTNTELTSVKVNKIWYPQTAITKAVTFILKGGAVDKSVTLDGVLDAKETVAWSYTFENLPKYRDGESTPITYVVEEVVIPGFESHRQKDNDGNYTFKNIEKTSVKVTKRWVGPEGTSAVITLFKEVAGQKTKVDLGAGNPVTLTLAKNWTHTFENLPKTDIDGNVITYSVDEEVVPAGFEKDSNIGFDNNDGHVIINRNAATRKITVNKVWAHPAGTVEPEITVELLADGSVHSEKKLNAGNNWTAEFSGLRKYAQTDGHEIKYLIREKKDSVPKNYHVVITGQGADSVTSDDAKVTLTNTIFGKVSVGFTKEWVGKAADSITVRLFRHVGNGDKTEVDSKKITAAEGWQHTFLNLDEFDTNGQRYIYTMTEDKLDGYTSTIGLVHPNIPNNFIAVNINDEMIEIPVEKKWVNSSVSQVTVRLYNGNVEMRSAVLSQANGWKTVFTGLRKYSVVDGSEIQYRLTEDVVPNFRTEITGDKASGFVVTNTYIPPIPPYVPETPGGETPTPVPPTPPTPPTEEIPNEPTPEGEPKKPTPPTPPTPPTEEIPNEPIPEGKTELPKTDGIPAEAVQMFGIALSALGVLLKKKK